MSVSIPVVGMSCAACVRRVETAIRAVPGVTAADVDLIGRRARVEGGDADAIARAIVALGFKVPARAEARALADDDAREERTLRRDQILATALTVPLMIVGMSHAFDAPAMMAAQAIVSGIVIAGPGRRFIVSAARLVRHGAADMSTLVALGMLAAWGASFAALFQHHGAVYFEAAAAIVMFVLIGKRLESRAKRGLADAVRGLVGLVPEEATRVVDGRDVATPVAALQVGDRVRLRAGERVPCDGLVDEGHTTIDEAVLTGESLPIDKQVDDRVAAGTAVVDGSAVVRVSATGEATAFGRIVRAVDDARGHKAPIARLADVVAGRFVPVVLGLALVVACFSIESAVAVLVVACPCALGLATPAAVAVATGRAAELGVLIRGGATLEALARAEHVYLDKTGTLTEGRPIVDQVDGDVLALAAAIERHSTHPIAKAIVAAAPPSTIVATDIRSFTGGGMQATVEGQRVTLGSQAFLRGHGVDATFEATVGVAIDQRLVGTITLRDTPRLTARALVHALRPRRVTMLTGDRRHTASAIAASVAIDDVRAELLPADKADAVRAPRTVMVGDGVNDAPALVAAEVGIAIGEGATAALDVADVVLVKADLAGVATALHIAQATLANIRQNLGWAFGYNLIAIPVAAVGLLSPIIASSAMALSSVSVVLNALRLKKLQPVILQPPIETP